MLAAFRGNSGAQLIDLGNSDLGNSDGDSRVLFRRLRGLSRLVRVLLPERQTEQLQL